MRTFSLFDVMGNPTEVIKQLFTEEDYKSHYWLKSRDLIPGQSVVIENHEFKVPTYDQFISMGSIDTIVRSIGICEISIKFPTISDFHDPFGYHWLVFKGKKNKDGLYEFNEGPEIEG